MNKIFLSKVIENVKANALRCPTCNQKADFEIANGIIVVKGSCCNDYYNYLSKMIQDEINSQSSIL